MKTYALPFVPGPVKVPGKILDTMNVDYPSADMENEFLDLYNQSEELLRQIFGTKNRIAIQTGEGMLALWGALKSTLVEGDRVLALATGVFGYGIGDMAKSLGAEVEVYGTGYDETLSDWESVEAVIARFKPKMITAVHCETPSGTLNPLEELGRLKVKHGVPLLYVDAVASAGGTKVLTDEWSIDLCLGGSQKVFSAPPAIATVAISESAWEIIFQVNYSGYDALKPFATAQEDFYFPYTPNWHGVSAINAAARMILDEGLEQCFARHEQVASYCRERIAQIGLRLFPAQGAVQSPTVTAVCVPDLISWQDLDARFRAYGLAVGGSYGPLSGKVFRLGHMGSQADLSLAEQALDVIEQCVKDLV
ncbi:MAG: aminotransferase class V-fold PLP-dependent enzyme [Chloroflexota bacterium]